MTAEARLAELGLALPPAAKPAGLYRPVLVCGNLAYTSGHGPVQPDGKLLTGRVGADLDLAAATQAARLTGLAILGSLRAELGSLDRIARVIKILGMVQCTPEFTQQPQVINGCSELFRDIWGAEHGVGTRSAIGMSALPLGMVTEIEAVFELEEKSNH